LDASHFLPPFKLPHLSATFVAQTKVPPQKPRGRSAASMFAKYSLPLEWPGINHVCMLPPFLKSVIKCPSHRPKVPAGPDLQCRSTRHRAKTAEAARIRDVGISPTTARVLTILAASSGQSNGRPGSGSQLLPGLFDSNRAEYRQTALLIATVDVSRLNICIYANCQCGQQDKFHLRLQ
jgi:hypothetical protein